MSFTVGHRSEFEDGVQGTLQVGQVVWKQRHNSEPSWIHSTQAEVSHPVTLLVCQDHLWYLGVQNLSA